MPCSRQRTNRFGLRMQSCKLHEVDWGCCHILEQLPVNALTSLKLRLDLAGPHDETECVRRLQPVKQALGKLQQLRNLSLAVDCFRYRGQPDHHLKYVDPLLQPSSIGAPLLGLTNLTSLKLNSLWSVGALQHLPASLLELEYHWEMLWESAPATLDLSHLTALTKLTTGHQVSMFSNAQLPTSLQHLQCGRLADMRPLQPLRFLQRLDILSCRSTAAELARLTSMTQLTHISLDYSDFDSANREYYWDTQDDELTPDAASPAWPALASQLRALHISDFAAMGYETGERLFQLSVPAVAALGSLSVMASLTLEYLQCPEVQPWQLAEALQRCTALQELKLGSLELQWDLLEALTGDEDTDALLIDEAKARGVAVLAGAIASLPGLHKLHLSSLSINMQAAAKLAAAAAAGTQLTALKLEGTDLADCGMSAIALGLTNLRKLVLLDTKSGDALLPALARLPLQRFDWRGCYFTTAATELFIPHLLVL